MLILLLSTLSICKAKTRLGPAHARFSCRLEEKWQLLHRLEKRFLMVQSCLQRRFCTSIHLSGARFIGSARKTLSFAFQPS